MERTMQELVGRLTALDPEASETLRVVAYFDALVVGDVGLQALLRGAAVLSGTVAGAFDGRRAHRIGPDGARLPGTPAQEGSPAAGTSAVGLPPHWPARPAGGGTVWLEREGTPHANDEMVVERLALAIGVVEARRAGGAGGALDIAVDAARDVEERRVALSRLRLDPAAQVRVAALPLENDPADLPSTVVATPHGLVRAVLLRQDTDVAGPAGLGHRGRADELPESFRAAVLALRLVPDNAAPAPGSAEVVDAADLGVLLDAVGALEPVAALQPDVAVLARLDARALAVLDELAAAESVRAAATTLGMHHSTLQARHDSLRNALGYDPRSLDGRTRFRLARLLLRLLRAGAAPGGLPAAHGQVSSRRTATG